MDAIDELAEQDAMPTTEVEATNDLPKQPKAKRARFSASVLETALMTQAESDAANVTKFKDLKAERAAMTQSKRKLTKDIKKMRKQQAKKDKVLSRRSTCTLVAELERRLAADAGQSSSSKA